MRCQEAAEAAVADVRRVTEHSQGGASARLHGVSSLARNHALRRLPHDAGPIQTKGTANEDAPALGLGRHRSLWVYDNLLGCRAAEDRGWTGALLRACQRSMRELRDGLSGAQAGAVRRRLQRAGDRHRGAFVRQTGLLLLPMTWEGRRLWSGGCHKTGCRTSEPS